MTQFIARKQIENQLESQLQQEYIDEPMQNIDKYSIMNQTLALNNSKLSEENSRTILVKLIYLANQGIHFNDEEVQQLVFRITKLFQSNNSRLREMTYKAIKMIMPEKYVHILIQSLSKDLMSFNPFKKVQALKFIPFIQSEQYIHQIERFVQNALTDNNLSILGTALIVGIHIVNKFPNVVGKWLFEVVQNLDQQQENIEFHGLILFHEIKKINLSYFTKILILLTKKQLKPLFHLQILKFINDILPLTEIIYKNQLITYLFQQVDSRDPLISFQTSKILINNFQVQNNQLGQVNLYIEEHLNHYINNIEIYSSLIMMLYFLKINERKQLITQQQIILVAALSFNYRVTLSSKGILFFLKLGSYKTGTQIQNLFDKTSNCVSQASFLKGLQEIIIDYPDYIMLILDFIKCAFSQVRENELVELAIQIVEYILEFSEQYLKDAYPILLILADNQGLQNNSNVIKIINKALLNIQSTKLDCRKLNIWLIYLKQYGRLEFNQNEVIFLRNQFMSLENLFSQLRALLDEQTINKNKEITKSEQNNLS